MDENTAKLAQQLKGNPALLQSLMRSRDGQALMQMLTRNCTFQLVQHGIKSPILLELLSPRPCRRTGTGTVAA